LTGYSRVILAALFRNHSWEDLEPAIADEMEAMLECKLGETEDGGSTLALMHRLTREHPGNELEHFVRKGKDLPDDMDPGAAWRARSS
jgi:hypothetical protein